MNTKEEIKEIERLIMDSPIGNYDSPNRFSDYSEDYEKLAKSFLKWHEEQVKKDRERWENESRVKFFRDLTKIFEVNFTSVKSEKGRSYDVCLYDIVSIRRMIESSFEVQVARYFEKQNQLLNPNDHEREEKTI